MIKAKVYVPFIDKHTGKEYKCNEEILLSNQRFNEIKSINSGLVGVVEVIPDTPAADPESTPKAKPKKAKTNK